MTFKELVQKYSPVSDFILCFLSIIITCLIPTISMIVISDYLVKIYPSKGGVIGFGIIIFGLLLFVGIARACTIKLKDWGVVLRRQEHE